MFPSLHDSTPWNPEYKPPFSILMASSKFHGRYESVDRQCDWPGCTRPGEFRAPGQSPNGFDGPGEWRWFCLDHVREFNGGYDWFEGMSAEEILSAQSPVSGWRTESAAFSPKAGVDGTPRWADFDDPLDAISARANGIKSRAQCEASMAMSGRWSKAEAEAPARELPSGWQGFVARGVNYSPAIPAVA